MSDHPCVVDPTLTECVELAEKLAAKVPAGTQNLTDVLKSYAPAVMERLNAAIRRPTYPSDVRRRCQIARRSVAGRSGSSNLKDWAQAAPRIAA